jgi:hypothetical protein
MAVIRPRPQKPMTTAVDLAIAALDGNLRPLDIEHINPAPRPLKLTINRERKA